ncbi:MAG: hypothetical protein ACOC0O_02095, partial [Spirochaetota bacterium]
MRQTLLIGIVVIAILAGCATPAPVSTDGDEVYLGTGTGASLGEAMNAAKINAVRRAVIDMIGRDAEAAQADRLEEVLYSTRNPNAYVYNDTMETLRRDGSLIEGNLTYEIRIRVNTQAVRRTLEANGIGRDASVAAAPADPDDPEAGAGAGAGDSPAGGTQRGAADPIGEAEYQDVTPGERRFIARYVDAMTYMVYFSDRAAGAYENGEFIMRSAVNQAN